MNTGLNSYKKIITSQWGEDGIIEEIFRRIGTKNKFCVEFGAGNGYELSNVWHLIKDLGWRALLMDANKLHFEKWVSLTQGLEQVKILYTYVNISGKDSLDELFKNNHVPVDLDLLSIDIDSDDYYVFKNLENFSPRVVVIEHNPTIPPGEEVVQKPGETEPFGASALALVNLAHEKGYLLAAATTTNCIFVKKTEYDKLKIQEPELVEVFDGSSLSYLVSALNGTVYFVNKNKQPSFSWFYKANNLSLSQKTFHALTFGWSLSRRYSKTLSEKYKPVKVLWDDQGNFGGPIIFIKNIFKSLFTLIVKGKNNDNK